jgi:hypothetical protein
VNTIIRAAILFLGFVWLALASVASAETLPYAKPDEVGFSSERLGRVTEMLRTNIAAGEIPGAVLLIARRGKIAYFESLGLLDPQAKTPMRKDAIFRIYSMSKPITSVAAMILFEEAKFGREIHTRTGQNAGRDRQQARPRGRSPQARASPDKSSDFDPRSDAAYLRAHLWFLW